MSHWGHAWPMTSGQPQCDIIIDPLYHRTPLFPSAQTDMNRQTLLTFITFFRPSTPLPNPNPSEWSILTIRDLFSMYLVTVDIKGEGHKGPNQISSMQSELLNIPHCPKGGGNFFSFLVRFVNMRPILKEMMKSGTCMKEAVFPIT